MLVELDYLSFSLSKSISIGTYHFQKHLFHNCSHGSLQLMYNKSSVSDWPKWNDLIYEKKNDENCSITNIILSKCILYVDILEFVNYENHFVCVGMF